jgi:hypothetical protein
MRWQLDLAKLIVAILKCANFRKVENHESDARPIAAFALHV